MKRIPLFMLAVSTMLTACSEKQLIHKEVKVRDVIVRWYSTSAISSTRGFVDVNYKDQWTNVLNCNDGSITDVDIDNGIIIIKSYKPHELIYNSKSRIGSLKIQQVPASTKEWLHYYQPEFENSVE
jgi:major membrane immunogen (membrane-anchored lipoprotein)